MHKPPAAVGDPPITFQDGTGADVLEVIRQAAIVARHWVLTVRTSSRDLLTKLESTHGQGIRLHYGEITALLAGDEQLDAAAHKFVRDVLMVDPLRSSQPAASTLDELFARVAAFQGSEPYFEALRFVTRVKEYAPFNNMLVFLQRPTAQYWGTAADWRKRFVREVRDGAIPILILRPGGPVMLVYDVADTKGPQLPAHLVTPFAVEGVYQRTWFGRLASEAASDGIEVRGARLGGHLAGVASKRKGSTTRFSVAVNRDHKEPEAFATLCHELAHVYLGHLGGDERGRWPSRVGMRQSQTELEAESVAHLVAHRLGLRTLSAEYLASHVRGPEDYRAVSIEMVTKVAGRLERAAEPWSGGG